MRRTNIVPPDAIARATNQPVMLSASPSMRNICAIRARVAPRATRIPSSLRRRIVRATTRLPTFATAISSTANDTPNSQAATLARMLVDPSAKREPAMGTESLLASRLAKDDVPSRGVRQSCFGRQLGTRMIRPNSGDHLIPCRAFIGIPFAAAVVSSADAERNPSIRLLNVNASESHGRHTNARTALCTHSVARARLARKAPKAVSVTRSPPNRSSFEAKNRPWSASHSRR